MNIRQTYFSSLKKISSEEILDLIFYRPLGFIIAFLLRKTFISPNMITFVGLIIGTSCGFVAYYWSIELGAVLLLFVNVLDCADGQLARLKQQFSKMGKFIDGFADYFTIVSFYFGTGFALIRELGDFNYFWLGLGAGITTIIHCGLFDHFRMRYSGGYTILDLKAEIENFKIEKKQTKNFFLKVFYVFTSFYLKSQLMLIRKPDVKITDFFIRLLSFIGPTTIISMMVTFSFFHRIDLFFYTHIILMNFYLILLFVFKRNLNKEK